jgi:hypothetical protein
MKKTMLSAAIAASLLATSAVSAASLEEELAELKARIKQLEQAQAQQAKAEPAPAAAAPANSAGQWFSRVEVSGLVEVEASYVDPDSGNSESDIVLATTEIGISAQVNDWVAADVVFLYEEDETDLEVDVATITLADPNAPWFVVAGQQYLPFGSFETHMVSDPLTLEIGEIRETALVGGIDAGGFNGGVYVFNGDLADGDERIETYGAFAGYSVESDSHSFSVNLGYISDIGDADGLQETVEDNLNLGLVDYKDQVAAGAIDAMFQAGPFTVIAEYIQAVDSFKANELAYKTRGAKPAALNLEAAFNFELGGKATTVALAYQETEQAAALELAEQRLMAAISVELLDAR